MQEALWLRGFEEELRNKKETTKLLCDNQSAIHLATNECYQPRTKHIDVRHHFIRQIISDGKIDVQHVSTNNMAADILTKPLVSTKIGSFMQIMGVHKNKI